VSPLPIDSELEHADAAAWSALGFVIGHATDRDGATGCTVVMGRDRPFRCAATVVGRASATRELATCAPEHLVDRTDAVLLTGGSAYGLDAAAGVMRFLEEQGRGFAVGGGVVPIVPAASIFDLAPLGRFDARPTPELARAACVAAQREATVIAEGSVGAGTGALVGKARGTAHAMKGGVGSAIARGAAGVACALVVVNAFGDVRDASGRIIAGARDDGGAFIDAEALMRGGQGVARFAAAGREHTTLAFVAVDAPLGKLALAQLAQAATSALHRHITPVATAFDGDVVFAAAPLPAADAPSVAPDPVQCAALEALAVHALAAAIERGVRTARGRDGVPGLADASATSPTSSEPDA
jgi:L-aminopeptidase/D-esterase-like protein